MKVTIETTDAEADRLKRLVENYKRLCDAIMKVNEVNEGGTWLLSLQQEGIHHDIEKIELELDGYRAFIRDEIRKIAGNLFLDKMLYNA